jgi:hypothetical protein
MDVASTDSVQQRKRARQFSKVTAGPLTHAPAEPLYVTGIAIAEVLADIADGIALRERANPTPK